VARVVSWKVGDSFFPELLVFATEPLRSRSLCNILSDEKMGVSLMNMLSLCLGYNLLSYGIDTDCIENVLYNSSVVVWYKHVCLTLIS
jgi:hypothetical protein